MTAEPARQTHVGCACRSRQQHADRNAAGMNPVINVSPKKPTLTGFSLTTRGTPLTQNPGQTTPHQRTNMTVLRGCDVNHVVHTVPVWAATLSEEAHADRVQSGNKDAPLTHKPGQTTPPREPTWQHCGAASSVHTAAPHLSRHPVSTNASHKPSMHSPRQPSRIAAIHRRCAACRRCTNMLRH